MKLVVVQVYGGVAEVTQEPKGVETLIVDWDNIEAGDRVYASKEVAKAMTSILRNRLIEKGALEVLP